MFLLWKYFALAFTALLPVVNPLGSALVFLGMVGPQPGSVYRSLARKIAIDTIIFFAVIELVGSYLLSFFGISLEIVQLAGGLVLASIGWSLLNQEDVQSPTDKARVEAGKQTHDASLSLEQRTFYPFTFPITAGPGCIVVMLTLSVHATARTISGDVLAHGGLLLAVILLSAIVYVSYAYAPQITQKISPATAHGILRVMAFILLCIGVQIAWNGLDALISTAFLHMPSSRE